MNALVALLIGIVAVNALTPEEKLFISHVQKYEKKYEGADSFFKRFHIFKENLAYIQTENSKNNSYTLGLNEFADMTKDEFMSAYTGLMQAPQGVKRAMHTTPLGFAPQADVDWRAKGAVTPIKNQGQCGSCWAFSTTGSFEGANQIFGKDHKLVSLSESQLVDCAGDSGNQGCNGGLMDYAFEWLKTNGACTEQEYPYVAQDRDCQKKCPGGPKVKDYKDVTAGSEPSLLSAVTQQPVSVAIEADQSAFQFYTSGVFTAACGQQLDHGVLAVGYGSQGSQNYWIIKNSWGTSWGEQGYMRMVRGRNQCGVNNMASYPVV